MDDEEVGLQKAQVIFTKFLTKNIHEPPEFVPRGQFIAYGTLAGMVATAVVHPLDLIKVRIQIYPALNILNMARRIIRCQGYLVFYRGLSASLLRQATNTSTRLMVYNHLFDKHMKSNKEPPSEADKVLMGGIAGLAGALVGTPSEVVLVRMMASSAPRAFNKCKDLQNLIEKPYLGCSDGLNRIIMEEGVKALWRGGMITSMRSIFVTAAQIGVYANVRDRLLKRNIEEGFYLHFLTTLVSSFFTTVLSLPVDIVKTRYQIKRSGVTPYSIFTSLKETKGLLWFWTRGFIPYYLRITVHTLTSYYVNENLNMQYYRRDQNKQMKK